MLKLRLLLIIVFYSFIQGCIPTKSVPAQFEIHSDKPLIMFILDTSGSMEQDFEEGTRISKAKKTIINGVNQLDLGRYDVGVVTFEGECAVKVAIPPSDNIDSIVNGIKSINTDGRTPLAAAIEMTGEALNNIDSKMVILLSDGIETCDGDPVSEAKKLNQKYGIDINFQVIGYAVDGTTRSALKKISHVDENWEYHEAKDTKSLKEALDNIYTHHKLRDENWVNPDKFVFSFDTGSAVIKSEYATRVQKIYTYLNNNNQKIKIVGHTDSVGSSASNYALSMGRASLVKNKLVKLGINESRISVEGKGENHPIMKNNTTQGRKKNRRIEIFVLQPK